MCNSQVGEHNLGKLCVRFGTVIRQFCASDCLEKFKASHKLCAQCQVNMTDKEKVNWDRKDFKVKKNFVKPICITLDILFNKLRRPRFSSQK